MKIQKQFLVAIMVIGYSTTLFAQDTSKIANAKLKAQAEAAELKVMAVDAYNEAWGKVSSNLGLTAEQEAQWKTLNQQYAQKAAVIVKDASLSTDEKKGELTNLYAQQQAELQTILTKKQYTKWSAEKQAALATAKTKAADAANTAKANATNFKTTHSLPTKPVKKH